MTWAQIANALIAFYAIGAIIGALTFGPELLRRLRDEDDD